MLTDVSITSDSAHLPAVYRDVVGDNGQPVVAAVSLNIFEKDPRKLPRCVPPEAHPQVSVSEDRPAGGLNPHPEVALST